MRIFVAHASDFAFKEKLYEPLRNSELNVQHEFILPEEGGGDTWDTRKVVESCDLVLADVSMPSTGAGIEMGWADAVDIPILAVYESGSVPSTMTVFLTDNKIEYENSEDLIEQLSGILSNIAREQE